MLKGRLGGVTTPGMAGATSAEISTGNGFEKTTNGSGFTYVAI